MSAIFVLPVWLTYWPRNIPHASTPTSIIPTKFEAPTPIRSWVIVITFPFDYHWKCLRGHCACAESRDPRIGGQKQLHIWNSRTRFAYSLCNFYWATTTIKCRLLSSVTNAKALDCVNFLCVTLWPWPLSFWPWTVLIHGGSRDQPGHQVRRPHAYPFLINIENAYTATAHAPNHVTRE